MKKQSVHDNSKISMQIIAISIPQDKFIALLSSGVLSEGLCLSRVLSWDWDLSVSRLVDAGRAL